MRFGVHLPIGGSLAEAPLRGRKIGCRSMQIFSGNPRGWKKPPLAPDSVSAYFAAVREAEITPIIVHAAYLINLAAPDTGIFAQSQDALIDELRRSATLGAQFYVVHSGSHKGVGLEAGRKRIIQALTRAAEAVPEGPMMLLENTAGTKNSLGTTFADLAALLDGANLPKLGVCFDTCHALAAGYEIRTPEGIGKTLDELDRLIGLSRLHVLHVNDSKGDLGSRLDRHEHIGRGCIGNDGFRAIFADRRLWHLPAILETPQDEADDDHHDLWAATELAAEVGAVQIDALEHLPTACVEPVIISDSDDSTKSQARSTARKKPGTKKKAPKRKNLWEKTAAKPRKKAKR